MAERLAAAVTAIAAHLDEPRLLLLARYSLWTVLLDDRVDDPDAEPASLASLVERVCAVAHGDPPEAGDALGGALAELLTAIRSVTGLDPLLDRLVDALCDATRAGAQDTLRSRAVHSGEREPPSIAEYLSLAARHVNYRSFAYGLVLLGGRPYTSENAHRVTLLLDRALEPACVAVRLANDLGSVHRDRAEGRLNVLDLRDADGSPVTVKAVQREIEFRRRRHDRLVAQLAVPALRHRLAPLVPGLRVALGVYRVADLR